VTFHGFDPKHSRNEGEGVEEGEEEGGEGEGGEEKEKGKGTLSACCLSVM